MKRSLAAFAQLAGGELRGSDRPYGAVSSDSRTIKAGELFVALSGPRFDGHAFLAAAAGKGAAGALVERIVEAPIAQVLVKDVLAGLQRAAAGWRALWAHPLIGVCGSNGKTTTKELIAAVLGELGPCRATRGNLNNHIGVPLSLLALEPEDLSAVIEMGTNRPGDVAALVALARPTVGLVTNAGAEHLEGFGDLDGVAAGEGELYEGLPPEAIAVVNADDAYSDFWRERAGARRVLSFGFAAGAAVSAQGLSTALGANGVVQRFTLTSPTGAVAIELALAGRHNVQNALAAAAAALAAGASLGQIRAGLARARGVRGRLQFVAGRSGARLLDDSYNANPSSLAAGLAVIAELPGERWLVLGDMGELGAAAEAAHVAAGSAARAAGVTRLFAIGALSPRAVESFGAGGEWFASADDLASRLRPLLKEGVTVLVKGSRVNRLERVVAALGPDAAGAGG
jgi:UDP-N-acetylmuramoyl-tripeptide--D-alanyl-D-alanine ligase